MDQMQPLFDTARRTATTDRAARILDRGLLDAYWSNVVAYGTPSPTAADLRQPRR
jgi:hypothetical protein